MQLSASVLPAEAPQIVSWSSSNEEAATISADGLVTAADNISEVTYVTFTATAMEGVSGSIEIKIELPDPSSVSISAEGGATSLISGHTLQLSSVVTPSNAPQTVEWSSSNEEAATIDARGLITAKEVGVATNVTFTATASNGVSNSIIIEIQPVPIPDPESVSVTAEGGATSLISGNTLQLSAVVSPTDAPQSVSWSSGDESVATIDADGLVTALEVESAVKVTFTATAEGGVSGSIVIEIQPVPIPDPESVSITAEGGATTLESTKTLQLSASVLPAKAPQSVTWSSSNADVASISETGLITAGKVEAASEVTFTATASNGVSNSIVITIEPRPAATIGSVTLNSSAETLHTCGDSVTLTAETAPEDPTYDEWDGNVTWSVSGDAADYVSVDSGVVTVLSGATAGTTAVVTATAVSAKGDGNYASASCVITIDNPTIAEMTATGYQVTFTGVLVDRGTAYYMYFDDGTAGIRVNNPSIDGDLIEGSYYTITGTTAKLSSNTGLYINNATATLNEETQSSITSLSELTEEKASSYFDQDLVAPSGRLYLTTSGVTSSSSGFRWTLGEVQMQTISSNANLQGGMVEGYAYNLEGYVYGVDGNYLLFYITNAYIVEGSVTISGENSVTVGDSITLSATTADGNNGAATDTYLWSLAGEADGDYATIDSSSGVLTGVAAGTVTVKATSETYGTSSTYVVDVVSANTITTTFVPQTSKDGNLPTANSTSLSNWTYLLGETEVGFSGSGVYRGASTYMMMASGTNKATAFFYNTDALSAASTIKSIIITAPSTAAAAATYNVTFGTSAVSTAAAVDSGVNIGKGESYTFTNEIEGATFFQIASTNDGSNGRISSVEIVYEPAA